MLMLMTKSIITMTIRRSRKQSWWSRTSTGASHQCLLYKGKDTPTRYIQVPGTWYQVPGTSSPLTFSILKTILNISCSQCGNSAGTKTLEWPRWSFVFSKSVFLLNCIEIGLYLYFYCISVGFVLELSCIGSCVEVKTPKWLGWNFWRKVISLLLMRIRSMEMVAVIGIKISLFNLYLVSIAYFVCIFQNRRLLFSL